MKILEIILIGVALSMDACALTISNCTTYKNTLNRKKEWAMPVLFALFQGLMPLAGFYIGSTFAESISSVSGYIVSAVFFALSIKMLFDYVKELKAKDESIDENANLSFWVIILQAVLTSIDALVVGVTLSLNLSFSIFYAVLIIAGVTFILVALALLFGKFLGKVMGKYSTIFGIVILFALALKNLLETVL